MKHSTLADRPTGALPLLDPTAPAAPAPPGPPARGAGDGRRYLNRATRRTVAAISAVLALGGVEHGIGEMLQGNVAPAGPVFRSWPTTEAFRILDGEPALSVVPNLLATGLLAVLTSLLFLGWATTAVQRRHGGLVLILLAAAMLLFGGGLAGPLLIGLPLGVAAVCISSPLAWWRTHVNAGGRRMLAALWPWTLGADLVAWLSLVPGLVLASVLVGAETIPEAIVYALIAAAFGGLLLAIVAALARDSLRPAHA